MAEDAHAVASGPLPLPPMTESFGVGSEEGDFLLNEESLGLLAAGAAKHDFAHDLGVFRAIDRDRQWAACRRGGRRQAHSMNVRR